MAEEYLTDAHSWLAAMDGPRTSTTHIICERCKIKVAISDIPRGGCVPQLVNASSGWPRMKENP